RPSPHTLTIVAGGSTKNPIVATIGKASGGNPYTLTISISPINPPPGTPDITTPLITDISIAVTKVPIPVQLLPYIPNRKEILSIADKQEPSICMVAPMGSTISLISFGTPIFCVASRFTGKVAILDCVAKLVTAGEIILLKNLFTPSIFPA